jgi:hypothetical protein
MSLKKNGVFPDVSDVQHIKMQLNMVVTKTMAVFWVFTMCTMVCPNVSKECAASVFRVT